MDKVEKMDCRILRVREQMPYREMAPHSVQEQLLGDLPGDRPIGIFRIKPSNSALIFFVDLKSWDNRRRRAHA